jgi:hypothetical protein
MAEPSYEIYAPAERPAPESRQPGSAPYPSYERDRRPMRSGGCGGSGAVQRFVLVSAICVAIWLMSGAGYFWPMWVMLGTGIPALASLTSGSSRRSRRGWC